MEWYWWVLIIVVALVLAVVLKNGDILDDVADSIFDFDD